MGEDEGTAVLLGTGNSRPPSVLLLISKVTMRLGTKGLEWEIGSKGKDAYLWLQSPVICAWKPSMVELARGSEIIMQINQPISQVGTLELLVGPFPSHILRTQLRLSLLLHAAFP